MRSDNGLFVESETGQGVQVRFHGGPKDGDAPWCTDLCGVLRVNRPEGSKKPPIPDGYAYILQSHKDGEFFYLWGQAKPKDPNKKMRPPVFWQDGKQIEDPEKI